jgi:hypothetical protein
VTLQPASTPSPALLSPRDVFKTWRQPLFALLLVAVAYFYEIDRPLLWGDEADTPPWEGRSKHFTKEFEAFALTLTREMPVKKAGEILGETDKRMWRMLHAHVAAARARADWSEVVCAGVIAGVSP